MIEIKSWINAFLGALDETFSERVWFTGLQGSYGRGEATETSDIDIVVILDELSATDIQIYSAILDNLPNRDKVCGFLSGRKEILNWDVADLFQFYYDTEAIKGSLDELLPAIDDAAVKRAIKTGACNIYHGCVHNMLHDKSEAMLKSLYKSASFVVQAIYFRQTGRYVRRTVDLIDAVYPDERMIVETYTSLKNGTALEFDKISETLFTWSRKWIEA